MKMGGRGGEELGGGERVGTGKHSGREVFTFDLWCSFKSTITFFASFFFFIIFNYSHFHLSSLSFFFFFKIDIFETGE